MSVFEKAAIELPERKTIFKWVAANPHFLVAIKILNFEGIEASVRLPLPVQNRWGDLFFLSKDEVLEGISALSGNPKETKIAREKFLVYAGSIGVDIGGLLDQPDFEVLRRAWIYVAGIYTRNQGIYIPDAVI